MKSWRLEVGWIVKKLSNPSKNPGVVDNLQRKADQVEWEKWGTTKTHCDCAHRIILDTGQRSQVRHRTPGSLVEQASGVNSDEDLGLQVKW